jgi:hypothetical protein
MTRFLHLPVSQYNLPSPPLITVAVLLLLLVFGCAPKQESITKTEVISTIEGLFEALDVTNDLRGRPENGQGAVQGLCRGFHGN